MRRPLRERVVIAGKYRLDRELARGGMGSVWVARHLQLDVPVAIKFMEIAVPSPTEALKRFKREAQSAAQIRSPHVVQILDHGVDRDVPYIVMELLEGEHLGDRLRRVRRLSLAASADIAVQVAKALRRAHEAGIIHRDLKPANIFLARIDEDEIVKVLDFGIAKAARGDGPDDVTKTGVVMGSPNYMSPEQARGIKTVDHRSDLWSLGVILFRAITGEMAFKGESDVDVILKICADPIPLPSEVAPDLPRELDAFFERALARDPAKRFQSAREMAAALVDVVKRLSMSGEVNAPHPEYTPFSDHWSRGSMLDIPPPSLDAAVPNSPTPQPEGGESRLRQLLRGTADPPLIPAPMPSPLRSRTPASTPSSTIFSHLRDRSLHADPNPTPAPISTRELTSRSEETLAEGPARGQRAQPAAEIERTRRNIAPARPNAPADPAEVSRLIDKGFSALRQGDRDAARNFWQSALDLDPSNRLLELNLRRLDITSD